MITPTVPSFYVVHARDEAAEVITAMFSPSVMLDIEEVVVVSRTFDNDIQPINEMDEALAIIKTGLGTDFEEACSFNPLYIPQPISALDDVLEVEPKSDNVRFVGMNENPYAIKITRVTAQPLETEILTAIARYQPFDLPSYNEIVEQQNQVLN